MIDVTSLEKIMKIGPTKNLDVTFDNTKKLVEKAISNIAKRNKNVDPKNVNIYMQGSYNNQTNVFTASNVEVVVELSKTLDLDADKLTPTSYSLINNYFVSGLNIEYTVKDFKDDLYLELETLTKQNVEIKTRKTIHINAYKDLPRRVDLLPAFSFKKFSPKRDGAFRAVNGLLIWDNEVKNHIITFPKLHEINAAKKDKETNGNFKKVVRAFKALRVHASTLEMIAKAEAPGYYIECMIYNVPNSLFSGKPQDMFIKVLNYLANADLNRFNCVNEQWGLFGTAAEFWNTDDANKFLFCMAYIWTFYKELDLKI